MFRWNTCLAVLLFVCASTLIVASETPVFPGAQGFGVDTPAGRGGRIVKVTNLESSGPGSLREAIELTHPRIIVFEVGGIIDLQLQALRIKSPYISILGQTAPNPGITLIRGGLEIGSHDVLLQHLRFRMGDAGLAAPRKGYEPGVSVNGSLAHRVVVDHCSFSWAVDQNLSVTGKREPGQAGARVTFSNNIIAEALHRSVHSKGEHSLGSLVHDHVQEIALIGNLFMHNEEANPWFKGGSNGVMVNNVIYNPGKTAIRLGVSRKEWQDKELQPAPPRVSIVGNVLRHGANTPPVLRLVESNTSGEAFMQDNRVEPLDGRALPVASNRVIALGSTPVWTASVKTLPSDRVWSQVLRHAGARPKDRDAVDRRLLLDAMKGQGRIIDSQEDVGGYPKAVATSRVLKVPEQGVDAWLQTFSRMLE